MHTGQSPASLLAKCVEVEKHRTLDLAFLLLGKTPRSVYKTTSLHQDQRIASTVRMWRFRIPGAPLVGMPDAEAALENGL
jgi:hypothetical protein